MKFTRANLFIVRTDAFSRAGQNHGLPNSGAPRPNATRVRNIRRPSADLLLIGTFVRRHAVSNAPGHLRLCRLAT
jgi:hypothetical protein